jgi:hypothetical protein
MHALGQGAESPTNSVVPQFEITRDAQGATLVDLMNTTGCTVWQTERPRDPIHVHPHSGAVGGRLPHGSSELEVHHSVAHYIVDDDSDHVLMRMTIPGHLVKRKSKPRRP